MTKEAIEMSGMLRMLLLILTVITFVVFISGKYMGKGKAFFLLALYVVFTIFIIGYSNDHPISVAIGKFMNEIVNFLVFWA